MAGDMLKKELLEEIINKFSLQRQKFEHYQNNPSEVEEILQNGALKAQKVAQKTLDRVRKNLGYN